MHQPAKITVLTILKCLIWSKFTLMVSFSQIMAASDRPQVFNGTCGAESGWVPVSGVAPSILTAQIEIQKKEKSSDRPPLLPAPGREVAP